MGGMGTENDTFSADGGQGEGGMGTEDNTFGADGGQLKGEGWGGGMGTENILLVLMEDS